ncbi:MAG TPA: formaldehyde-activating enzyme [Burkholderiales bacterium]|nr:formaldehyde-activating enzyme [Burkholderiales bacterium]
MGLLDTIKGLFGGGSESPAPASAAVPAPRAAAVKIDRVLVGESLVGDGNEVAHIDLLIGPRGSAVEKAFANSLTNNKDGFTSLLAVVAPNLLCKPNAMMFNKVTIKGAKQAVQMFGPAQRAVAMAVADSVAEGVIPQDQADNLFICVGVFIHWEANDDKKIQDFNYRATKEAIARAVRGEPTAAEVTAKRGSANHPFQAHK